MNASVSATRSAFCACSSTSSTAHPRSRSSRIASITASAASGARPSVGSSAISTTGGSASAGCEAQHLLLAAREQPGHLLAALATGSGTARRRPCASCSSRRSTVRFSSTVRPGKMPRASGTSRTPARARRNGSVVGDLRALEVHRADRGLDDAGRDRAQRRLAGAVGAEQRGDLAPFDAQVDAVEHLGVAVARDHAAHRERGVGDVGVRQSVGARPGARRVPPSIGAARSCSGTSPPCASASASAMRASRAFSRFLRSFC